MNMLISYIFPQKNLKIRISLIHYLYFITLPTSKIDSEGQIRTNFMTKDIILIFWLWTFHFNVAPSQHVEYIYYSFMTIDQISNMSSTIVTSGAEMFKLCNLDLSPVLSGFCIVQSLVFFVVSCVFQSMFFCQLYCLFFNLRLLTTPLVSNFFSWIIKWISEEFLNGRD